MDLILIPFCKQMIVAKMRPEQFEISVRRKLLSAVRAFLVEGHGFSRAVIV